MRLNISPMIRQSTPTFCNFKTLIKSFHTDCKMMLLIKKIIFDRINFIFRIVSIFRNMLHIGFCMPDLLIKHDRMGLRLV